MSPPVNNARTIHVRGPVTIVGPDGRSWQPDISPDRADYVTTDGVEVWMERKVQKTRFLDAAGNQVGPVHANFVPAIVWAAHNGWRDPSDPAWFEDALIASVRAGGAPDDEHRNPDAGCWVPEVGS